MSALNPYLNFNGNCEEAMNYYKSVFGGEFAMIMRYKDVPEDVPMPDGKVDGDKIMHVSFPIGKSVLMASDCPPSMEVTYGSGGYNISVSADSKEDADKFFNGLSAGGNTIMPMADAFWGSYFGMCVDKFGISWMISFDAPRNN